MARAYETTVVSLTPPADAASAVPGFFSDLGVSLVRVPHRPPPTLVAAVRGLVGRWPYMLTRYRSAALDATLRKLVAERRPRVVLTNGLHVTTSFEAYGGVPVVLRTPDLVHLWLERYAARVANPIVKAYAMQQAARMKVAEREIVSRCARVLAIRDEEARQLRELAPAARVEYLPLGLDLDRYLPHEPASPPIVALIGSWDWAPNVDGARAFLERGWRRVRDRVPGARLRLAGKHLPPDLATRAEHAGAEVVGYVPDMATEFAQASVMVVPLWMGSGVRVKIVEAMAARVPVVTTPIGAEGLDLSPGEHAEFADTPEALADAVAGLLGDRDRAQRMAHAARHHVERHYSLAAIRDRLVEACEAAVRDTAARA